MATLTGTISPIYDGDGGVTYPVTSDKAVYCGDSTTVTLDKKLASVDSSIATNASNISAEVTRATNAENELNQNLAAQKVYGGEVTPSAIAPGATGTVTVDLSAQFSSITSVSATVNATEPQIYPVGATCSGTTVKVYVHNGSQYTLAPTAYYMVIGAGK